jgi:hypothetical protein
MKKTSVITAAGSICAIVAAVSGCATTEQARTTAVTPAPPALADNTPLLSGKVLETMNSGGYTYLYVEHDGRKKWVAIPLAKIEVGQEVRLRPGMEMGTFRSSTLRRTFDSIIFTQLAPDATSPASDAPLPQGHPQIDRQATLPQGHPPTAASDAVMPHGHPAASTAAPPATTISGTVVETMDSGGYTYVAMENAGKKTWIAMPVTKVSVGQQLEIAGGTEFTNFSSKTLNRTFERIIFSSGPVPPAR